MFLFYHKNRNIWKLEVFIGLAIGNMNHNTMLYNYAKRTRNFWGVIILIFLLAFYVLGGIFNKTIIPHA